MLCMWYFLPELIDIIDAALGTVHYLEHALLTCRIHKIGTFDCMDVSANARAVITHTERAMAVRADTVILAVTPEMTG